MSGTRNVVVTGMGVVCALADRPDNLFEALCDGRTAFAAPTLFAADAVPGHLAAEVKGFAAEKYLRPGNVRPLDRTGRLALVGVELALADAGWSLELRKSHPVGLVVGTMFCGVRTIGEFDRRAQQAGPEYASPLDFSNTVLNAAAGQVAIWQHLRGVNSTIAAGPASGVLALVYASELVRTGRADVLLAGGADELCFESFLGFSRAGRLAPPRDSQPGRAIPFDADRTGALLGEGSAFLVLEAEDAARARGAKVLGRVLGGACGFDPGALTDPSDNGKALARTIRRALAESGIGPNEVGVVSSSASGSPVFDRREAAALEATVGSHTPVTAIKAMTGEALGASGPLQTIAALESMRSRRLPGVAGLGVLDPCVRLDVSAVTRPVDAARALITALTPEGNCAALVISAN